MKQPRLKKMLALFALVILALLIYLLTFTLTHKEPSDPDIIVESGDTSGDLTDEPEMPQPAAPEHEIPVITVDVVVFGSELEGLYLARAAADEGLQVIILDPREAFGGQVLQGQMLFLDETRDDLRRSLAQGRVKQLFDDFRFGRIRKLSEFEAYFERLVDQIPIESAIQIETIETKQGANGEASISAVEYRGQDGVLKRVQSDYWVENTDHAAFTSQLEVSRLLGIESYYKLDRLEFMAASMMMKFNNVDWKKFNDDFNRLSRAEINRRFGGGYVNESFAIGLTGMSREYTSTDDRVFLRGLNAVNQRDGEVLINALLIYDVDPADPQSVSAAVALGHKELPLILAHFRERLPGWEHAELSTPPDYLYIRDYHRYETDYVLQTSDLLGARMFWDNVSIAGYPLDLQGTQDVPWGIQMGVPDKYGMPLRSFLLKNYENVIVAGKNVGASIIAFGSARIQPNTSIAAEVIGVILGQIHPHKQLKQLEEADMIALHTYIQNHYNIQLFGITGNSRLIGWTEEELSKLDSGEIYYPTYSVGR